MEEEGGLRAEADTERQDVKGRGQGAKEHKRRMKEAQGTRRRQELGKIVTSLCGSVPGLDKVSSITILIISFFSMII